MLDPSSEGLDVETWRRLIGSQEADRVRNADVRIWVTDTADAPDVHDSENERLQNRLEVFWKALLLTRAPRLASSWIVTGWKDSTTVHVTGYRRLHDVRLKEPPPVLSLQVLEDAAATAVHLEGHFAGGTLVGRFERGLAAFLSGMRLEHVDEGILALVRSLEGILHPADRPQFVKRLASVAVLGSHGAEATAKIFTEIYNVRSRFTHAMTIDSAFPGMNREFALDRARRLQILLYLLVVRAYTAVLVQSELVSRFGREGSGEYWGKVVSERRERPFQITVDDHEWLTPSF